MPTLEREDLDSVNAILTVRLEHSDYAKKIKDKLKELRKKANMKGFRAGQVPMSMIRKMYGKNVVFETVNEMVQEEVGEYIDAFDRKLLGQPLPVEDDSINYDFSVKRAKEGYTFKFQLGLEPQFELQGYSKDTTQDYYNVTLKDEVYNKEIENLQKRLGEQVEVEGDIQETDVLSLDLVELADGEVKEGGLTASTTVAVDLLTEENKAKVLTLKNGDTLDVNISELDTKTTEDKDIRKYILGLGEEQENLEFNDTFRATITATKRFQDAEINEAFFEKAFPGGEITDLEGAKAKMGADILSYYKEQADKLFFGQFQKNVIEANEIELPADYLKNLIKATSEGVTDEQVETEYESFSQGMKWSVIQSKIAEKEDLKVTQADIEQKIREETMQYFGNNPQMASLMNDEFMNSMVERMLQDKEAYNRQAETIMNEQITVAAKEALSLNTVEVDNEGFDDAVKAYNEAINPTVEEEDTDTTEDLVEDVEIVEEEGTSEVEATAEA